MSLIIVDSALGEDEAFEGRRVPVFIRRHLKLISLEYWSFDDRLHRGQIIVNAALADEVREIFLEIIGARFPIGRMIPVCHFDWNDDLSMAANNSSGFNPRRIAGSRRKSQHAAGRAIDINPWQNPWVRGQQIDPPGAEYNPAAPGTLTADSAPVLAFLERGWEWGGNWETMKDWHHFEKG